MVYLLNFRNFEYTVLKFLVIATNILIYSYCYILNNIRVEMIVFTIILNNYLALI